MSPPGMRRPRLGSGADAGHETTDRRDSTPPSVLELNRIRRTAREIVAFDAEFRPKALALLTLGFEAAEECGEWGRRGVWQECREFFGHPEPTPRVLGDALIRRHRSLRHQGYATCPRCGSRLLDELDAEREAAMRGWTA